MDPIISKAFLVIWYKFKMVLNDRMLFIAMVAIPLLIIAVAGYAFRNEKANVINLAIVDEDLSTYSRMLVDRLSGKEGLSLSIAARDRAVRMLKGNRVEVVFILKKGFEENIIKGSCNGIIEMLKAPSSYSYGYAGEVVAGEVMRLRAGNIASAWVKELYQKLNRPVSETLEEEVEKYTESLWNSGPLMEVIYQEVEGEAIAQAESVYIPTVSASSTGIVVMSMMLYLLFSSGWLIEERVNGTLKRLFSIHNAIWHSFIGNIAVLVILGAGQTVLLYLVGKLAFGMELFRSSWVCAVLGAYLMSVISISLFLSAILKTPAQLQASAPVLALLTGFAGGCFWNHVDVPARLKLLSLFTPQGWALKGLNELLIEPANANAALLPVAVLLIMALILFLLSYIIIRAQVNN